MFKWSSHFDPRMAAKHDCPGFVQCFFYRISARIFNISIYVCMHGSVDNSFKWESKKICIVSPSNAFLGRFF